MAACRKDGGAVREARGGTEAENPQALTCGIIRGWKVKEMEIKAKRREFLKLRGP